MLGMRSVWFDLWWRRRRLKVSSSLQCPIRTHDLEFQFALMLVGKMGNGPAV